MQNSFVSFAAALSLSLACGHAAAQANINHAGGPDANMVAGHPVQAMPGFDVLSVSADGLWATVAAVPVAETARDAYIRPDVFTPAVLDMVETRALLSNAPTEAEVLAGADGMLFDLPMPETGVDAQFENGFENGFDTFAVYEIPMLAPELAARYPSIRTYAGRSLSDPTATVRISVTELGFDAFVLRAGPDVYVDRYSQGDANVYTSYFGQDLQRPNHTWSCGVDHGNGQHGPQEVQDFEPFFERGPQTLAPVTLRTFQAAVATTGEYTQFFGGTVDQGLSALTTAMNRVSGIYERDLAARLQLVANNDLIIFTNPNTDPFGNISLSQIDSVIDGAIGSNNYDVGHLVDTGGGGFAQLAVVCTGSKGRGYTGLTPPTGDRFFVDYFAHELGHQFAATHTFNGDSGACAGGNRTPSTAFEPGSGTTIMGYAGICGNDNVQTFSDDYFHFASLNQMSNHIASRTCDTETATGNNTPVAMAGSDIVVPINTPFFLTGSGSDEDNDTITYTWEQADLGPQRDVSASDNGSSPIFRSFEGTTNPTRFFPRTTDWRDGNLGRGEQLPTIARILDFNLVVRDNALGGGGYDVDGVRVQVINEAGPFRVTSQNSPTTNTTGTLNVTWDVANTAGVPLFASTVDILFSTDNAATFPVVLATATPNDGAHTVTLPAGITTDNGYLMVRATNGNFFDINKGRINVEVPVDPVVFSFPDGLPEQIVGGQPTTLRVNIDPGGNTLVPPFLLLYGYDGPASNIAVLNSIGGTLYEGVLPAGDCEQTASFYFFTNSNNGDVFTIPEDITAPFTRPVVCDVACPADYNQDGTVNVLDVIGFITVWNAQTEGADYNGDGSINVLDVVSFITIWNAGCP
jgi:hypothetical protein